MRTANTKICVKKGTMSMKVNGEKIVFKVFEESQLPQDDVECFNACMIQGVVENVFQDHQNPLHATLTHNVTRKDKEPVIENATEGIMEVVKPPETPPSHPCAKREQQLEELGELRNKADENNKLHKGRTKTDHDKYHAKKEFQVGQKVWTYKSRFRLIPGKFKYQWFGLCIITNVLPRGALEVHSP
jgi:hypothetical protein